MGWFGNIAGKVRSWFDRDETHVARRHARGATNDRFPTQQRGLSLGLNYQGLISDWVSVDRDLTSRYRDYEDMDEYPALASAIDIFADDATQIDGGSNRTVWITSSDKRIQEILDDELLQKRLVIDEEAWEIVRTLVKYGNDYEEVLLGPDGVVGLNFLPPATVRRIEDAKGNLIGFLQDFKERFHLSPKDFADLLETQKNGRSPTEDPNDPNYALAALEDWEVIHFRLRSKYRRSVYGFCLVGESRVWTPLGVKRLDEVQPGDEVYTRHAGMLRTTKVLDHVCSGTKPVFRLKTTHREIRLTAEHPMLVDRGGKNNAWVPVEDLHVGDKLIAVASQPETVGPVPLGITARDLREDTLVCLTAEGIGALKTRNRPMSYAPTSWGLRPVARLLGISRGALDELLKGRSSLVLKQARALFQGVGLPLFAGSFQVVEDPRLRLPDFVDRKFAMLFGFLLGDGWIHGDQVYFALKKDEEHNQFYEAFFESYGLETSRTVDDAGVERSSYVSCKKLVEVLADLGWAGEKAHEKRVPSWVYAQSREVRESFLRGFLDADGWETDNGYEHTELCNEEFVRDLKMLIDGLGWTCGNVRRREERTSRLKNGKEIHSGPQYTISFRCVPLSDGDFASERVESIESDGEELVYDIEVADRSHCFVADGLVVHNSVLEPARWIWKRLTILEDSAILFRLTKAVERFAFYIDVGDMPPAEALAYVNQVRQKYRKKKYVNPTTGKLELRFDALSQDEDFFVPSRGGQDGTRIDVVGAPQWQHMDDIEYFLGHLFSAIKVPKSYLGQEQGVARAVLSSEDVRFARSVLRVQREFKNGIRKVSKIHLMAKNIDPSSVDFEIWMTVPSAIFELAQLEVRNARADLAARMQDFVSLHWILKRVFNLPEEDIAIVIRERGEDMVRVAVAQGKGEAAAQKMISAALPQEEAPGAAAESRDLRMAQMMERVRERSKSLGYGSSITREELHAGDSVAEKQALDKLDAILRTDKDLAVRLAGVSRLLHDLAATVRSGNR